MKLRATGGTDIATMVIYWPELISPESRLKYRHDPGDLAAELRRNGHIIEFPCDADGSYSVEVFVDENPPAEYAQFVREQKLFERVAARGPAFFEGAECLLPEKSEDSGAAHGSTDPDSALAIPEGNYTGRVYRLEVPEEHAWHWLQTRFDAATLKRRTRHGSMASYAAVLILAAIITAFFTSWKIWGTLAALALIVVFAVRRMGQNPAFEKIRSAEAEYDSLYPAYVAELRSV